MNKTKQYESNQVLATLINAGADLETKDNEGNTALMCAVANGNAESVKALLKAGASIQSINNDGLTACDLAIELGMIQIAEIIIDSVKSIREPAAM